MVRWWWPWGLLVAALAGLVLVTSTDSPVVVAGWGVWAAAMVASVGAIAGDRLSALRVHAPRWAPRVGRELTVFTVPAAVTSRPLPARAPTDARMPPVGAPPVGRGSAAPAHVTRFVPQPVRGGGDTVTHPGRHPGLQAHPGRLPAIPVAVDGEGDGFVPQTLAALLRNPASCAPGPAGRPRSGGAQLAAGVGPAGIVTVDLLSRPVWEISGPGQAGVLRALLVQMLACPDPDNGPCRLVVTAGHARRLGLPDPARLGFLVAPTLAVAVRHLAAEIRLRAELAATGPAITGLAGLRAAFPDEPLPALLAVVDTDEAGDDAAPAVRRLLAQAHHFGVSALLVGGTDSLHGYTVAADGSVLTSRHVPPMRRAFTLAAAPALRVLRQATRLDAGAEVTVPLLGYRPPAPPVIPPPAPTRARPTSAAPRPATPPAATPSTATPPTATPMVRLVTFGRPHLASFAGQAYHGLLSMEIAAYLAAHRDGAATAALVRDLLPDADPVRAKNQIHQAIRRLRDACQHAASGSIIIETRASGYRLLLRDGARCDLWEFQAALADAEHANSDPPRIAALRRAVAAYQGRFCGELDAAWAAGPATAWEQQAIAAHQDLADLLADDDPTGAAAVLEQALRTTDPHFEPLYTHLMRLHGAAGRLAEVRRVHDRLATRLAALDTQVSPATTALLARLLRTRPGEPRA